MFGMERSGTTLLSLMVGAHPDIAVPYPVAGLWYDMAKTLGATDEPLAEAQIAGVIDQVLAHRRIQDWDVRLDAATVRRHLLGHRFPDILSAFYDAYRAERAKPCWAQMDISTLDNIQTAARWFPDARFVHIVRDGRDVALSHQTMPFGSGNIAECAVDWVRRLEKCQAVGDVLGPQRFHAFRYEDLILTPEETLGRLCAFLGVDFSSQMLAYEAMIDEKVPPDRLWLWPSLRQPPDHDKVARWKQEMTKAQRIIFEDVAGDLLGRFGYERLQPLPKSLRAEALSLFYHATRGGRLKRARQRLGLDTRTALERGRGADR